jgi:hypothetical protein
MLTFRTSITFAVMAFIVALTALLIVIQVLALQWDTIGYLSRASRIACAGALEI